MANVNVPNGFRFAYSLTGHTELVEGILKISSTIARGDALIESGTAGQVGIALATSGLLLGISAENKVTDGTTTKKILFYPAIPTNVFVGQCEGTEADTMIYSQCDIIGATGVMEIDENASVEDVIYIIGREEGSAEGANARMFFIIIRSSYVPLLAAQT